MSVLNPTKWQHGKIDSSECPECSGVSLTTLHSYEKIDANDNVTACTMYQCDSCKHVYDETVNKKIKWQVLKKQIAKMALEV